jgi:hypothetical protein
MCRGCEKLDQGRGTSAFKTMLKEIAEKIEARFCLE